MFGGCHPPIRLHFERIERETTPAQIFDRTRIYDRIDARRNLSLGEVHWQHSPRWTAHSLCVVPSTQTQQSARIHGRCRAAKLQAAPAKTLGNDPEFLFFRPTPPPAGINHLHPPDLPTVLQQEI